MPSPSATKSSGASPPGERAGVTGPKAKPAAGRAVCVIGGATAGAEIAGRLAERGAQVVVIEQNPRPYGKIEDGLPRWHVALRRKEYAAIDEKLAHPNVHFVPLTRIGRDLDFADLTRHWGFHAVVLACGAWRDRALPVPDAERYVGRGLVYQNPFIVWFNHANEQDYTGPRFTPEDGVLVVGGGLASIDVVKVLMLETTRAALAERGIDVPMIELETKGIPKTLEKHGLRFEELGLRGCTLVYRRRVEDMPLVEMPPGVTPERRAKVEQGRRRAFEKAVEKYRFRVEPLAAPDALLVEEDRVVGLRLRRTRVESGKVLPTDETFELRGPYVISSIGSIPEPIPGIPQKGELFDFTDWETGTLADYANVFSAGNVVTGKGNIVASRKHATRIAELVAERFLGVADGGHEGEEAVLAEERAAAERTAKAVAARVSEQPPLSPAGLDALLARVRERQRAVGYTGDYPAWLARVTPPDLE